MMDDIISTLPDCVLYYILSFLPTNVVVATSVLSKRWKSLWRSVPTLNFDDNNYSLETYSNFVQSMYAFIISRDFDQPLTRFFLTCRFPLPDPLYVNTWVMAAIQRRVEHLDLSLSYQLGFPSTMIFSCKTLVVLKLTDSCLKAFSFVDLPSLKILHLRSVSFSEYGNLVELLSGTPNLEDLEVIQLDCLTYVADKEFKRLPKLLRAHIFELDIPLEVVNHVEFLCIEWMVCRKFTPIIPEFHNLTHIEFGWLQSTKRWLVMLKVIKQCPKLQIIVVDKNLEFYNEDKEEYWQYPHSVPICISLHLKTCYLKNCKGSDGEFQFARYVMENARYLQTMTICTKNDVNEMEKYELLKRLSSCTRYSPTCELSFE